MRKCRMPRFFYSLLLYVLLPLLAIKLCVRSMKQRGYRPYWRERFGCYDLPRQRPVIWLHCVSVGETRAAAPLVTALLAAYPQHSILLTHGSASGRATSEQLFGERVQRAYLAYDLPFAVKRFLKHFQPDLGVLMETELWFNLLAACQQQGIPMLLANARLSEKSAAGYAKLGKLARDGLQSLSLIAAQTSQDAARFQQLGANQVATLGQLKFDVLAPGDAKAQGQYLRALFGVTRPVFLAASTRDGEEALILDAIAQANVAGLLTVIVPRHPQRFELVAALLKKRALVYEKRSQLNQPVSSHCQVILGDSMGELFSYYASADLCLVGGSLLPYGGQNLIEPMRMGKAVLIGEHSYNFSEVAATAVAKCAAWRVSSPAEIAQALQALFSHPEQGHAMGAQGLALCEAAQGATQRTLAFIAGRLKRPNE